MIEEATKEMLNKMRVAAFVGYCKKQEKLSLSRAA